MYFFEKGGFIYIIFTHDSKTIIPTDIKMLTSQNVSWRLREREIFWNVPHNVAEESYFFNE